VLRLSKPDAENPEKRRHFEISIDSPFHILSCRASAQNTELPAYTSPESDPANHLSDCGCPGAPRRRISPQYLPTLASLNGSRGSVSEGMDDVGSEEPMRPALARPPTAHINGNGPRPIHLLRQPSFNPPAFEDEEPPPPMMTPPPQYGDIASPTAGHGLADYFSRLNSVYDDVSSDEDDSLTRRGRVNIPLTPGGRVNRSLDLGRGWMPVGANGLT
jgi:hypothetical protein